MDSLASLAFSSRLSYPRSDLSELSLRKSSNSRLRLGSLTSSDISVGFRGHPLHYCYSAESPPSSSDVCDRVLELSPEQDKLRMCPWLFRFKSTAGEAVDQGWKIQPPSLLPNLSVDPSGMVGRVQPQGHHWAAHNPTTEDVWGDARFKRLSICL